MWGLREAFPQTAEDREPAACSSPNDPPMSPHVSAAQLCTALNRPDLPALLGTPGEHARTAAGSENSITLAGGTEIPAPEANVRLDTHSVQLSASFDDLSVAETAGLLGAKAQTREVLGHPAVLHSDRTIAISFDLDGNGTDAGPGTIARRLLVVGDAKDGGDSYEVVVRREDAVPPDDAALIRVAEKVLPTVPGWTAG